MTGRDFTAALKHYFGFDKFKGDQEAIIRNLMAGNDLLINWELKEYPRDFGEDRARATVDRLVGLIDRFGVADRSILNSYSDRLLEYAADRWPGKFALHGYPHYRSPKDVTMTVRSSATVISATKTRSASVASHGRA